MVTEVVAPQPESYKDKDVNLKEYYYDNHKVILGLAVLLQCCLLANLFVFFKGELGVGKTTFIKYLINFFQRNQIQLVPHSESLNVVF